MKMIFYIIITVYCAAVTVSAATKSSGDIKSGSNCHLSLVSVQPITVMHLNESMISAYTIAMENAAKTINAEPYKGQIPSNTLVATLDSVDVMATHLLKVIPTITDPVQAMTPFSILVDYLDRKFTHWNMVDKQERFSRLLEMKGQEGTRYQFEIELEVLETYLTLLKRFGFTSVLFNHSAFEALASLALRGELGAIEHVMSATNTPMNPFLSRRISLLRKKTIQLINETALPNILKQTELKGRMLFSQILFSESEIETKGTLGPFNYGLKMADITNVTHSITSLLDISNELSFYEYIDTFSDWYINGDLQLRNLVRSILYSYYKLNILNYENIFFIKKNKHKLPTIIFPRRRRAL